MSSQQQLIFSLLQNFHCGLDISPDYSINPPPTHTHKTGSKYSNGTDGTDHPCDIAPIINGSSEGRGIRNSLSPFLHLFEEKSGNKVI